MASESVRIGMIGAGNFTRVRLIPGFRAIDGVEIVAVCNRSEDSGRRVAVEFDIARVTTDPDELFASDDIDAIYIGTWPYRHREFSVRALEAGKHVLCEGRMAMDAAEAREMLAAAQSRPDLVAQLVPGLPDGGVWRTIRRMVAGGELGDVREAHVTALSAGALADAPLSWREQRQYSGMNTMFLGLLAEVLHRWIGPTERVVADATAFIDSRVDEASGERAAIELPDSLGVLARMASGARATYRLSTVLADAPRGNRFSLYGSKATLHWQPRDGMTLAPLGEEARPLEPDPGSDSGWQVEQDFVDSIRDGKPVGLTSFEDGVRYMQFVEAVWRSWSEGRAVALSEV